MPRVKEIRYCIRCKEPFHRHNGNVKAKYCSVLCSRRDLNTKEHQIMAGKAAGAQNISRLRGTGRKDTYIKEYGRHQHRVVAEKILGRRLKNKEIVHHINENKHDNRPENLAIVDRSDHARIHFGHRVKKQVRAIRPSSRRSKICG